MYMFTKLIKIKKQLIEKKILIVKNRLITLLKCDRLLLCGKMLLIIDDQYGISSIMKECSFKLRLQDGESVLCFFIWIMYLRSKYCDNAIAITLNGLNKLLI